jgi:hypothetical protein
MPPDIRAWWPAAPLDARFEPVAHAEGVWAVSVREARACSRRDGILTISHWDGEVVEPDEVAAPAFRDMVLRIGDESLDVHVEATVPYQVDVSNVSIRPDPGRSDHHTTMAFGLLLGARSTLTVYTQRPRARLVVLHVRPSPQEIGNRG